MPPLQLSQDAPKITLTQFIEQGYADKIQRGECRVYLEYEPAPEDISLDDFHIDEIASIDSYDGYFIIHTSDGLGHIGTSKAEMELIVFEVLES